MSERIHLLVQGMHLRADSIAYDVAFQSRLLRSWGLPVEVYAETFDPENYPGIEARSLDDLARALRTAPGLVVYHWVDGWRAADDLLLRSRCPLVVRWHNNTPPWFFAGHSAVPTHKTVRGYLELLRVLDGHPNARVWVNSEFSRRQLGVLGIPEGRVDVIHPASAYLERDPLSPVRPRTEDTDPIRLLFVGRIVPHKGHLHLIAAAHAVGAMTGRSVRVLLPGRPDGDMPRYVSEIRELATRLRVEVDLPGEVGHEALERAYREADVFVGLSEHEGFGLPILEAMTRGLPVVGYRCSAVSELLEGHPWAVDTLDPVDVARRILAALDETARGAVVAWQTRAVLPRFARTRIAEQLRLALRSEGFSSPSSAAPALLTAEEAPAEAVRALERALEIPAPVEAPPRHLPRDLNPHFVTRYDLSAYRALLRSGETGGLRGRALALRFGSHRKGLGGGFTGLLKTAMLRLQDGLIRTIELSHNDLADQLREMSERVETLALEVEQLRGEDRELTQPTTPTVAGPRRVPSRSAPR